ncbi:uncharacterized protein LOC123029970 [Varanus komodoensis]|uniref:uncharacterized protein LOC123029970 n=1 Tax=Varanus komodoensis TaxID=61221 RepID=UPI001CF7C454|nr:uncharacterized protein LOC123029970 [Varanus komodoensis]
MCLSAGLEGAERGYSPPSSSSSSSSSSSGDRCRLRLALALACVALVVSLAMLAMTALKRQEPLPAPLASDARNPPQAYAQLVLKLNGNSQLTNRRTLDWYDSTSVQGVYLDSMFEYSSQGLTVKHPGRYCIFAQLTVKRLESISKQVEVSLIIHRKNAMHSSQVLIIPLDLSANSSSLIEKFSAVSSQLANNDTLSVMLMVSESLNSAWTLHQNGNFFGLFEMKDLAQK